MRLLLVAAFAAAQAVTAQPKYSPTRNAEADVKAAVAEAQTTQKRILLEVGGEWCSWCHILDRFFSDHPDAAALRDRNYITVKVNVSAQNQNKALLSRYPPIPGYPHFFVLESDGTLLYSQKTSALEQGPSYNLAKLTAFLNKWAPPGNTTR